MLTPNQNSAFWVALCISLAIVLAIVWSFPQPDHFVMSADGFEATRQLAVFVAGLLLIGGSYALHIGRVRRKERRHDQEWQSTRYEYSADPAVKAAINEARAYRQTQKNTNRSREFGEIATILLLYVAGCIGVLQWQILRKTDQTLRLQQRAWIAPRGMIPPENFKTLTNKYTEVVLGLENTGREPARKTNEVLATEALAYDDFRNEPVMEKIIQKALNGRSCESIPLKLKGRSIFPGGTPSIVVPFEEEKVAKINARTHYALVIGCFVMKH